MKVFLCLIPLFLGCVSSHTLEYRSSVAEAREYLQSLAGDRFDEVVEDYGLHPLFDEEASYEETASAARRAVRWRINVADRAFESGSVNLAMVLAGLLGRKPHTDADEE